MSSADSLPTVAAGFSASAAGSSGHCTNMQFDEHDKADAHHGNEGNDDDEDVPDVVSSYDAAKKLLAGKKIAQRAG